RSTSSSTRSSRTRRSARPPRRCSRTTSAARRRCGCARTLREHSGADEEGVLGGIKPRRVRRARLTAGFARTDAQETSWPLLEIEPEILAAHVGRAKRNERALTEHV